MNEYYENKVAVVTGGASGIGLALCELLLSLGARAVALADLNIEKLETETARLEHAHPGRVLGIRTDVTRQQSVVAMIRQAAEFGAGQIHFLFNNAGLGFAKSFNEATDADWRFAFDLNFFGPLYGIRAVLPIMRAQGSGHIANTASGVGFMPQPFQSMYSATKSALIGLTGALRAEFWDENIRLSTIIPGVVATPIWDQIGAPPDFAMSPEECARAVLKGLAANERIVIVADYDVDAAINAFRPDHAQGVDEYFSNIARQRRQGKMVF
jgi:NAD(P)-dependent dehydrogenase (short-subunit alcohol dehydrogenase family)